MNTGLDKTLIRESYQRMTDDELIRLLTEDSSGLTPEATEVAKEEISRRQLDVDVLQNMEAQQSVFTEEEIDNLCELIRNLPCPYTGSTSDKLNASLTAEVFSFIFLTRYKKKTIIGCPEALTKANNSALTKSVLFGWWGFPWGIIRTIQAININMKSKNTNHLENPNDLLRTFVLANIREIEKYKDNEEELMKLIADKAA